MKQSALSLILSAFFLSPRFLLFAHGGESSTSSSNYCSSLVPGDLYFYMVQSQIPNQIGIVGFADMPGGLEIFLTDNAWTGESFQTNEGTLKVSNIVC